MSAAIYPGSFDPITKGHLNIISRASKIFDRVVVCVMVNAEKAPMFTREERVAMIRETTKNLPNVIVDSSPKLLAEYAREQNIGVIVKGLRAATDFEKEFQMAMINHKMNDNLDTMFLTSEHRFMYLSSSVVKELGTHGADVSDFLPEEIMEKFNIRITQQI
ncbi:MAG: pantetheine-phosphate adenylyltransferase [Eubacteriales bacterium]